MKKIINVFLGVLVLAVCGCAVKVQMPTTVAIYPEARGGFLKGNVDIRAYKAAEVTLATDTTGVTPDTTPSFAQAEGAGVGAELGIFPSLDLYLTTGYNSANVFGVKYQLLGDSAKDAKAGNFSLAIAGGFAAGQKKTTASGASGSDISSEIEVNYLGWEAMVLAGYRLFDSLLFFGGPRVHKVSVDNTITRTAVGVSTVTADTKGEGQIAGLVAGVRWDLGHLYIVGQGSVSTAEWERREPTILAANKLSEVFGGVNIGFGW